MQQCSPSTYIVITSSILLSSPSLHVTVALESPNMALRMVILDGLSRLLATPVSILGSEFAKVMAKVANA